MVLIAYVILRDICKNNPFKGLINPPIVYSVDCLPFEAQLKLNKLDVKRCYCKITRAEFFEKICSFSGIISSVRNL